MFFRPPAEDGRRSSFFGRRPARVIYHPGSNDRRLRPAGFKSATFQGLARLTTTGCCKRNFRSVPDLSGSTSRPLLWRSFGWRRRRKLESETDFELGPAHLDVVYETAIFVIGVQVAIGKTAIKVFETEFQAALRLPREI
jgi:hypothetical protein